MTGTSNDRGPSRYRPNLRLFARRCWQRWTSPWRARNVARSVEYVSGPLSTALKPTDLVVLCLVRDGEAHLPHFLEHHFRLGARFVVILDNGSVDNTPAIAREFDRVTLLRCGLPYREYQYEFRRFLVSRFGSDGWSLVLDVDERFDYPLSDRISLEQLLTYLNGNRYTAVPAQMLDLFPGGPLSTWPLGGWGLVQSCHWYDISSVFAFWPPLENLTNRYPDPPPRYLKGGIRKTVFGLEPTLTKYPLLRPSRGAQPVTFSSHFCQRARVADISCLLAHYKFDSSFKQRCLRAIQERNYYDNSREYRAYLRLLESESDLTLKRATARRFQGADELLDIGFLTVSDDFRAFVSACSRLGVGTGAGMS